MGYAMLTAPCFVCGAVFSSNPRKVPSFENQPVCRACMAIVNARRSDMGLAPHPVDPKAYEPCDEREL